MIIPEDDGFLPTTTSNLNNFNNQMVVKVPDSWKSSEENTFQLSTLDRSHGLSGWPADRFINEVLDDHQTVVEGISDEKKTINLDLDTSGPKFQEINYCFVRNHHRSVNAKSWESMGSVPLEPSHNLPFKPPVKKNNSNFPRKGTGLLGDCPVARILPNAPGGSVLPFQHSYSDFLPPPPLPPLSGQRHNLNVYEDKFGDMEPLKNFTCTKKRDSRMENGHHYRGGYSQRGKNQRPRHNTPEEPYDQYIAPERMEPGPDFRYKNSYNRNEASNQSHISPKRNSQGTFRNELDNSYMGNEIYAPSHVPPEMDNRDFSRNYSAGHFKNYQRKQPQTRKKNNFGFFNRRPWASPMKAQRRNSFKRNRF